MKEAATSHSEQLDMITSDLKSITENTNDLLSMLNGDTEIEPWVAAKITLASSYVESVRDYIKYGNKPSEEDCERCVKQVETMAVDNIAQKPGTANYMNAVPNG